jgi:uncharacterized protein YbbK (DUF523 family)
VSAAVPRIVVSKCLEFEHCRYNSEIISSETSRALKPLVVFVPVCPVPALGMMATALAVLAVKIPSLIQLSFSQAEPRTR